MMEFSFYLVEQGLFSPTMGFFQNKFNMTAMESIRERSRHHHRIFTGKSDDIASLLALPNMDAHKLWNLTSHSKQSMIKEVGISIYFSKIIGIEVFKSSM